MRPQKVAQKLMEIKAVFPEADAANVFLQWPIYFLATDAHAMEANVDRLQSILPDVNIHRYNSACPTGVTRPGSEQCVPSCEAQCLPSWQCSLSPGVNIKLPSKCLPACQ